MVERWKRGKSGMMEEWKYGNGGIVDRGEEWNNAPGYRADRSSEHAPVGSMYIDVELIWTR